MKKKIKVTPEDIDAIIRRLKKKLKNKGEFLGLDIDLKPIYEKRRKFILNKTNMYYQKTKWGKAKKQVVNGRRYDSGFEANEAWELEQLKKKGEIKDFQPHYKIPLKFNGYLIADYYVDFRIEHNDGIIEFRETKGWPITKEWKMKWKILEAMTADDPDVKLTLIKQKNFNMRKIKKL